MTAVHQVQRADWFRSDRSGSLQVGDTDAVSDASEPVRHGEELEELGKWNQKTGRTEELRKSMQTTKQTKQQSIVHSGEKYK